MVIEEKRMNLFEVPEDFVFAHCISADFALGAGIAIEFNKRFDMKKKLKENFQGAQLDWIGDALRIDNVYNLVTKFRYYQKPTYYTLSCSVESLKLQMELAGEHKLAIPKIGCGLDKLSWGKVKRIIEETFNETDVHIIVCYL